MVSKKLIAPTLAGTGAAGASGVLSWALSLFDGEDLKSNVEEKKEQNRATPPKQPVDPNTQKTQTGSDGRQTTKPVKKDKVKIKSLEIKGTEPTSSYFASGGGASVTDKQVINSELTWSVEWIPTALKSLWVRAEGPKKPDGTNFSWRCRLKAIFLEETYHYHDLTEFESQGSDLINAIKDNNAYREQFVKNCSKAGADKVKEGLIELEIEKIGNSFKFKEKGEYFKKLWTKDFTGAYKLSEEDEELSKVTEGWKIEKAETTGKIKISSRDNKLVCYISGTSTNNFGNKTFNGGELEKILKMNKHNEEREKKKYLIRNCRKNNDEIKGLKIKFNGSNWWFEDDSLKKISEGMYTNPTSTI